MSYNDDSTGDGVGTTGSDAVCGNVQSTQKGTRQAVLSMNHKRTK